MTSRDSYRRPVSSEAALAELRRVSGTQLDPAVVAAFTRMILERGVAFSHADATDFESELTSCVEPHAHRATRAVASDARAATRPGQSQRSEDPASARRSRRERLAQPPVVRDVAIGAAG